MSNPITDSHAFAPYEELALRLLPFLPVVGDGSHDIAHLLRVWANIRLIQTGEGGDLEILIIACLLHDCVAVEKNSAERPLASRLAAERSKAILTGLGWPEQTIVRVAHAIEAHSFSAGIEPGTVEAEILQDADRLDAIGSVGIARCFYTAGRMGSALYDAADPLAESRAYDDARYAMDHFQTKLLHLAGGFRTQTGRGLAAARHRRIERFVAEMAEEIGHLHTAR